MYKLLNVLNGSMEPSDCTLLRLAEDALYFRERGKTQRTAKFAEELCRKLLPEADEEEAEALPDNYPMSGWILLRERGALALYYNDEKHAAMLLRKEA